MWSTVNLKGATSSNHLGFGWNKHLDWKLAACNLNWIFTVRVPAPWFWGAITPTDWPRPITARHVCRTCPGSAPHWVEPSTLLDRFLTARRVLVPVQETTQRPLWRLKALQMQPTMLCHSGIYQAWPNLWERLQRVEPVSACVVYSKMPQLTLIFATCCASYEFTWRKNIGIDEKSIQILYTILVPHMYYFNCWPPCSPL